MTDSAELALEVSLDFAEMAHGNCVMLPLDTWRICPQRRAARLNQDTCTCFLCRTIYCRIQPLRPSRSLLAVLIVYVLVRSKGPSAKLESLLVVVYLPFLTCSFSWVPLMLCQCRYSCLFGVPFSPCIYLLRRGLKHFMRLVKMIRKRRVNSRRADPPTHEQLREVHWVRCCECGKYRALPQGVNMEEMLEVFGLQEVSRVVVWCVSDGAKFVSEAF